jgi:serine/threonine protein kinase
VGNMCRVHAPCLAPRPQYFSFVVGCAPQGGLRLETVVDIMRQVLAGLRHLHSLGILHRDLRAANVLVESLDPIQVSFLLLSLSIAAEGQQAFSAIRDMPMVQDVCTSTECIRCGRQGPLERLSGAPSIGSSQTSRLLSAKRACVAASLCREESHM